jgi:hypothetical protein
MCGVGPQENRRQPARARSSGSCQVVPACRLLGRFGADLEAADAGGELLRVIATRVLDGSDSGSQTEGLKGAVHILSSRLKAGHEREG